MQFVDVLEALDGYTPEEFLQIQFYFLNDSTSGTAEWVSTEKCEDYANKYCPKLTAEQYYLYADPVNFSFGRSFYAVVNSCVAAKKIAQDN